MTLRPRKSYSDIGHSPNDDIDIESDIRTASIATGAESVSSGNRPELSPELAFVVEFAPGQRSNYEGVNIGNPPSSMSAGALSQLLYTALPRRKRDRIRRAFHHAEKDDLVSSLIETLADFSSTGFSLQAKPPSFSDEGSDTQIEDFQQRLNEIGLTIDAPKIVLDLMTDWFICDSMILYWRTNPGENVVYDDSGNPTLETSITPGQIEEQELGIPGIIDIAVLKPSDVDWDNSIGNDLLMINIPDALVNKINDALMRRSNAGLTLEDVYNSLMSQGIPKRWIDTVRQGKSEVQLLRENGDNWIIKTRARNYHGLACPTMFSVFLDLEVRNILKEGDASAALMMKQFIMLIKQGESIETGALAGNTRNWLKKPEATALLKRFSITNRAMMAAVNHTTKIEFVYPPKEMFDPIKYAEAEKRIFNWSGVNKALSTGDSSQKYSSGFIGIKRTIGKIKKCREVVDSLLRSFFLHETVRPQIPTPEGYTVRTSFDSNVLKEPRQLLDELKFLMENNSIDPRSALRELERDADAVKVSKMQSKKENEETEVWSALVNPLEQELKDLQNQGSENPEGRPANPGTERTDATRNQNPIARQTNNTP